MARAIKIKICDVRDWDTAKRCADLGVDLIGIHCIDGIKDSRRSALLDLTAKMRLIHPTTGVVLVTRVVDPARIVEIARELRPGYVQLHSEGWAPSSISQLRELMSTALGDRVGIIGVLTPHEPYARFRELCPIVDMTIIDRGYYGTERVPDAISPTRYVQPVEWVKGLGGEVFIAGGLTPVNVLDYVDSARPDGIDIQSGVEVPGMRGSKDFSKVHQIMLAANNTLG